MKLKDIKIIHITHIDNLKSIVTDGCLYSDAQSLERKACLQEIGMSHIKQRRLTEIEVTCHPGTKVGNYVPFYFWHHSPMLYLIHKRNDNLDYKGGQKEIVHLVATMSAAIEWANDNNLKWAFTSSNAGAFMCDFYDSTDQLSAINWDAVKNQYWSNCKDEKQAEFLVLDSFSFSLFNKIVVHNAETKTAVEALTAELELQPDILVKRNWYYP